MLTEEELLTLDELSDEELLKKIQPGFTEDIDKYYVELAHSIVDNKSIYLGDPAIASLEDLKADAENAEYWFKREPTPDNELEMLRAKLKYIKAVKEYKTNFSEDKAKKGTYKSSIFPRVGNIGGRLKTRRRKRRNGSSRVRRHRSRRVSGRKVKA